MGLLDRFYVTIWAAAGAGGLLGGVLGGLISGLLIVLCFRGRK